MSVRVTSSEVKEILDTDLSDPIVEAYITSANVMVNDILGTGETDVLKNIELWLTAHMIASTRERQLESATAGPASAKFQGVTGKGLESTLYGQMVLILDTSGGFASLGLKRASISAITSFA